MGKIIDTKTVNVINRCRRIVIDAPYQEEPTITQEYCNVYAVDGVVLKEESVQAISHSLSDLSAVSMEINGNVITGAEIAEFFFRFNESPDIFLGGNSSTTEGEPDV